MCISSTWPGQQVVELGKLHGKQLPRHVNHYLIHHAAWKVPFSIPLPTPAFLLPQGHQTRILTAAAWAFTLKNFWCTSLEWSMQLWMTEHFKQCEFGAKSLAKSVTPNVDVWSTQPIVSGQGPPYLTLAKNLQESVFVFQCFQRKITKDNAYPSVHIDSHTVISKKSDFCLIWPLAPTAAIENSSLSTLSLISYYPGPATDKATELSSAFTTTSQVNCSVYQTMGIPSPAPCASAYCCTRWTSSGEELVLQNTWFH